MVDTTDRMLDVAGTLLTTRRTCTVVKSQIIVYGLQKIVALVIFKKSMCHASTLEHNVHNIISIKNTNVEHVNNARSG